MTRWPRGAPGRVPRPRSPLAHGPSTTCSSCATCATCAGGTRPPTRYRVTPAGPVCTDCPHAPGRTCLNLAPDLERLAPC